MENAFTAGDNLLAFRDMVVLLFFIPNIEDFGDFEEYRDAGEVETSEEFEKLWRDSYPEESDWYEFAAVDDTGIDYRAIFVGHRFCIQVDNRRPRNGYEHDISPFTGWLLQSVKDTIQKLKDGTYLESLSTLSPRHRTGTITRSDYWKVYPDRKKAYFGICLRAILTNSSPLPASCLKGRGSACPQ